MVPYTQGKWEGKLVTEMVSVGSGAAEDDVSRKNNDATQHSHKDNINDHFSSSSSSTSLRVRAHLACIETSKNFFINGSKWHGILGLGYPVIARPSPEVTPFMESLTAARALEQDLFALRLCGTVDTAPQGAR